MPDLPQDPVLVIDDEPAVLNLLKLLLERAGFNVVTSGSGPAALKLLDTRFTDLGDVKVSCVLCDWKMPNWDGLRFLKELRARPYGAGLPFVLMSGAVSPERLEEAAAESADGILLKPVDEKVAQEKILKAIEIRSGR